MRLPKRIGPLTLTITLVLVPVIGILVHMSFGPLVYYGDPIVGTVVDAETRQPLAGTVIVAEWILYQWAVVDGAHTTRLHVTQAMSGADGVFRMRRIP